MNRALQSIVSHALRTSLAVLALALILCRPALAQSSRDIVGGPITTARLERLLAAYVRPTAD